MFESNTMDVGPNSPPQIKNMLQNQVVNTVDFANFNGFVFYYCAVVAPGAPFNLSAETRIVTDIRHMNYSIDGLKTFSYAEVLSVPFSGSIVFTVYNSSEKVNFRIQNLDDPFALANFCEVYFRNNSYVKFSLLIRISERSTEDFKRKHDQLHTDQSKTAVDRCASELRRNEARQRLFHSGDHRDSDHLNRCDGGGGDIHFDQKEAAEAGKTSE